MGDDLRQLKWKSTAVNLRLFFRLFDNNTFKKTHKCWSARIFLLQSLFADLNRLVSKPAYNKIILNILHKQSFIIKNYHLNRCTLEKKSPKVIISLNKPQPELKLRVDVQMYHDFGCLKAIKKCISQ